MIITAKFDSFCLRCLEDIDLGERIEWEPGKRATHIGCKPPPKHCITDGICRYRFGKSCERFDCDYEDGTFEAEEAQFMGGQGISFSDSTS